MSNENKIRILYVQPGKYPEERLVANELHPLQRLVGGDGIPCNYLRLLRQGKYLPPNWRGLVLPDRSLCCFVCTEYIRFFPSHSRPALPSLLYAVSQLRTVSPSTHSRLATSLWDNLPDSISITAFCLTAGDIFPLIQKCSLYSFQCFISLFAI